jgi:DNA/RNA-binding domain of Phe-tRNA-synthetase-like protein
MLTENTVNAFLIIESVDPDRKEDLIAAAASLAELTGKYLGGSVEIHHMDRENREIGL